ncbi:hypothetical protein QE152_g22201 [Popillia japonica]|uniref:Uncharacterized protein n=1 Tax=Popillia japonica TaxID=7064 RepID=A0AAW1KLI8_POPJA
MLAAVDQHQEFKIHILDSITLLSKSTEYFVIADNNLDTWEELSEIQIAGNVLANKIEENMEDLEIDNTDTEFEPLTILQAVQAVETLRKCYFREFRPS